MQGMVMSYSTYQAVFRILQAFGIAVPLLCTLCTSHRSALYPYNNSGEVLCNSYRAIDIERRQHTGEVHYRSKQYHVLHQRETYP